MGYPLVLPCESDKFGKGWGVKSTASQREPCSLRDRSPAAVKFDVQRMNAVRVSGFGEEFKLEVPLAGVRFVEKQPPLSHVQSEWILPNFLDSTVTSNVTG